MFEWLLSAPVICRANSLHAQIRFPVARPLPHPAPQGELAMAVEAGEDAAALHGRRSAPKEQDYGSDASSQWRLVAVLTVVVMLSAVDRQALALLVDPIKAD